MLRIFSSSATFTTLYDHETNMAMSLGHLQFPSVSSVEEQRQGHRRLLHTALYDMELPLYGPIADPLR